MGFVSKLLLLLGCSADSQAKTPTPVPANGPRLARTAALSDSWLTLNQSDFFGKAYLSPNQRWVVGCNDSDGAGRGGYREAGNGRVVLVDYQSDQIKHELMCFARPVDAVVSDAGRYIVQDSGFGSALQGDLVAIEVDGRERYRKHYSANIFNIGLSKCGRYAAVQTANAPSNDGNLLEVLDLERSCVVFSVRPVTGWASSYSFDVDVKGNFMTLLVEHKGLGIFSYSASGEFKNKQDFQAAQLNNGDYSTKITAAQALLKAAPTSENAKKALKAADLALAEGAQNRPDWASSAHRIRGESYELLGQSREALSAYDTALSLNPKVGVQKRAAVLRKMLSND